MLATTSVKENWESSDFFGMRKKAQFGRAEAIFNFVMGGGGWGGSRPSAPIILAYFVLRCRLQFASDVTLKPKDTCLCFKGENIL